MEAPKVGAHGVGAPGRREHRLPIRPADPVSWLASRGPGTQHPRVGSAAAAGLRGPWPRLGTAAEHLETSPGEAELRPMTSWPQRGMSSAGSGQVDLPMVSVSSGRAARWRSPQSPTVPGAAGEACDLPLVPQPLAWGSWSWPGPPCGSSEITASLWSRVASEDPESLSLWSLSLRKGLQAKGSAAQTWLGTHTTFWSLLKQISITLNYSGGFQSGRRLRELISICPNEGQI